MIPASFWQEILPPNAVATGGYPARFDDGRILLLPIRHLPDGKHALASLIINQASFTVVDALAKSLAQKLAPFAPDVIVGLPTLGLTLASAVAQILGHARYVPLGNSAKFWYRAELSVPLSSVTTRCCRAAGSPWSMTSSAAASPCWPGLRCSPPAV